MRPFGDHLLGAEPAGSLRQRRCALFTTGPATGAAIAAMIGGAPPPFDVTPFAPDRYI
jgi:hypothetical protein